MTLNEKDIDEALETAGVSGVADDLYELEMFLSTDGKHTVHVKSNNSEGMKKAYTAAVRLYDQILERYGTKQSQAVREYGKDNKQPIQGNSVSQNGTFAPVCGVHGVPMKLRNGQWGDFWSCPTKNHDGSWCKYKPPKE